jgi:hypothetical protein
MVEAESASAQGGRMFRRALSTLLVLSLFATSLTTASAQETQQNVSEMRKLVLKGIEKNRRVTVVLKKRKDKLTGVPSNVSEQGFTLQEEASAQQRQFDFEDVREVRMKGSHLGLYIGLGVVAVVVVIAAAGLSKLTSD